VPNFRFYFTPLLQRRIFQEQNSMLHCPKAISHNSQSSVLFHLSLTVLIRYRSLEIFRLRGLVPLSSDKVSRAPSYFSCSWSLFSVFLNYRAFTFYGVIFQWTYQITRNIKNKEPTNRRSKASQIVDNARIRLIRVRSPLLTESRLIFFPWVT